MIKTSTLLILFISLFGFSTLAQNVGVGTTSPRGKLHIVNSAADTSLVVESGPSGRAAKFKGSVEVTGAIRNYGNSFDGSVAVNDGLTVGDLSGAQCNPSSATNCTFNYVDASGSFQIDPNEPAFATSNNPTCTQGQCRQITSFDFSADFFDYAFLAVKVDIYIQNQFQYKVLIPDALDSTWTVGFTSNDFNNTDPDDVSNWSVLMSGYDPSGDSDRCEEYTGTIYYNWGDSANISYYAAFGEVRASGTLYANSTNPYGDVAEFFEVTDEYRAPEYGDIVSISVNTPQAFALTNKSNDPLIAGVISENPSVYINNPEMGEPIALTGRVKVKVNMEGGAIQPGDPITSSATLAEGMKQNEDGTIIGYALEAYDGEAKETGKIWILLAKGHYEKVAEVASVYEGAATQLGGVKIKGSHMVMAGEKESFIPWSELITSKVPADIDFDDLVVNLDPFGGSAALSINNIDANGIYIGVTKRSKTFKGFYYNIDLVSPAFYVEPSAEDNSEDNVSNRVEAFIDLYNKTTSITAELTKLSSAGFDELPANMSIEEAKVAKNAVLDAWRNADSRLFNQYIKAITDLQVMLEDAELKQAVSKLESF